MLALDHRVLALPVSALAMGSTFQYLARNMLEAMESGHVREFTVRLFRDAFPEASISSLGRVVLLHPHAFWVAPDVIPHGSRAWPRMLGVCLKILPLCAISAEAAP